MFVLLALLSSLLVPAQAAVNAQSPALRQLADLERVRPDGEPTPEGSVASGGLGFTVQSLKPVGYLDDRGQEQPVPPRADEPTLPRGKTYVFDGTSRISGVTIYRPREDTTGEGRTEKPPREGLGGGLLMYAGIGAAAGAALLFTSIPPLLIIAAAVVAVIALLFFFNRKSA
jgi:hypothetical protein